MENNINIELKTEGNIVTFLQGKVIEPCQVERQVSIDGVLEYLKTRRETIDPSKCHLIIDKDKKEVVFYEDEHNQKGSIIKGELTINKELEEWGINTGKEYSTNELSEFIKMNTLCFESRAVAMSLSTKLKEFKGKVTTDMEKSEDNRGNHKFSLQRAVESNIPEAFKLEMFLFSFSKEKIKFNVEIYIDSTFTCKLYSIDLKEAEKEFTEKIIEDMYLSTKNIISELPVMFA